MKPRPFQRGRGFLYVRPAGRTHLGVRAPCTPGNRMPGGVGGRRGADPASYPILLSRCCRESPTIKRWSAPTILKFSAEVKMSCFSRIVPIPETHYANKSPVKLQRYPFCFVQRGSSFQTINSSRGKSPGCFGEGKVGRLPYEERRCPGDPGSGLILRPALGICSEDVDGK